MADINGLELIRFIRRSEHHRTTPLSSSPRSAQRRTSSAAWPSAPTSICPSLHPRPAPRRLREASRGDGGASPERAARGLAPWSKAAGATAATRRATSSSPRRRRSSMASAATSCARRGPQARQGRRRARQRRLPRRAHAEGAVGPLRRDADGGSFARARGPARRPAPRPRRASRSRCSTCSSRRSSSTGASSSARAARRAMPAPEVEALLVALGQCPQRRAGGGGAGVVAQYELDPGLLGVLTEYEEHRLRTNIQQGHRALSASACSSRSPRSTGARRAEGEGPAARRDHHLPADGRGRRTSNAIELEILMASRAAVELLRERASPART